jgi:hypothetical protein
MVIYQSFVEEEDDQKFKTQTTKNGASRPWTKKRMKTLAVDMHRVYFQG